MDEKTYARWHQHPIRQILLRAHAGEHVYPDTIQRLGLPDRVRQALEEAIERVKPDPKTGKRVSRLGAKSPDHLSAQLVEALPDTWETPSEKRERLAGEGDADALASLKAEEEARERMVDRIASKDGIR